MCLCYFGPLGLHKAPSLNPCVFTTLDIKMEIFWLFLSLCGLLGPPEAARVAPDAILAPFWSSLGLPLDSLGALLGAFMALLGSPWGPSGSLFGPFGLPLALLGAFLVIFGSLWALLGPEEAPGD